MSKEKGCLDRLRWQTAFVMEVDDLSTYALFLDLDGTVIDIAPTPGDVVTPAGIPDILRDVGCRLNGALAILTGRPIADVDRILAPLAPKAAGVHGAERRVVPGGPVVRTAGPVDAAIVAAVDALARTEAGAFVERKPASIALHYRLAPTAAERIEVALRRIVEDASDKLEMCVGRKVFEIVPRNVSKGAALVDFMQRPEFVGRRPIMIGDDVSDLSAFEAATGLGGRALRVAGEFFAADEADFSGPADVRDWLARQAERTPST